MEFEHAYSRKLRILSLRLYLPHAVAVDLVREMER